MLSIDATPNGLQPLSETFSPDFNGHHATNGTAPQIDNPESALLGIMARHPGTIKPICLQQDPLNRNHFHDPVAGCTFAAFAHEARDQQAGMPVADNALARLRQWSYDPALDDDKRALAQEAAAQFSALSECAPAGLKQADAKQTALDLAARIKSQATSTHAEKPAPKFAFTTDSDLDERLGEIEWLWPGYIPRGLVTGIVADQDQGKSTIAQNFCDTILRGARWPDGTPHTPQPETKLLWIDTEGSIALFHQRAKSWGMPRGRFILPPDPLQELTVDDFEHWAWIEAAIEKFQPPLVVIDALSGAHKSKESGNDEMKLVMKKLAGLAQRFNIAVLVVHHLNKPAPGVASYPISIHRLRGASAIPQYCRSILALGTPDVNQPENRRLDVIKLNIARKPEPIGYLLTDSGPMWGQAPEAPKQRRAIDDALDFLEIAMQSGARLASDVEEEAKAEKIGGNALRDAKKVLKIKALREGGTDGRWFWHPENSEVAV
jgi:putative DNA primase/helicase